MFFVNFKKKEKEKKERKREYNTFLNDSAGTYL